MLRRINIITAAALATCALSASVASAQTVGAPDHVIVQDSDRATQALGRDYGSPDALDAIAKRGIYTVDPGPQALNRPYGSPDARDAARDLPRLHVPTPTVAVRDVPSSSFDWGDAGIGAAGMLALFSIAAGSALLLVGRKRRRGVQVAMH